MNHHQSYAISEWHDTDAVIDEALDRFETVLASVEGV